MNNKWSIPAKPKKLCKIEDKKLNVLVKDTVKLVKQHMKEHAWPLDADLLVNDIICDYFGMDLPWLVYSSIINNVKGTEVIYKDNKAMVYNTKQKVYYNPIKHRMYIDTRMDDVDTDIALGGL